MNQNRGPDGAEAPPGTPPVRPAGTKTTGPHASGPLTPGLPTAGRVPAGPADGYDTDDLMRQLQPAEPKRSRRGWRSLFGLPPSKAEQRELAQLDAVRSQFARPVTIMVANPKGGTGKTPISLLLAGSSARPAVVALS